MGGTEAIIVADCSLRSGLLLCLPSVITMSATGRSAHLPESYKTGCDGHIWNHDDQTDSLSLIYISK